MSESERYDVFVKRMHQVYPLMFAEPYGGFAISEGWWPIIENLCHMIQAHIDWVNSTRARLQKDNPHKHTIPVEVPQVVVAQIKEKFGGLRFYYDGGDDVIDGMVCIAEVWASRSCETCGDVGTRGGTGWVSTLCPTHRAERESKNK